MGWLAGRGSRLVRRVSAGAAALLLTGCAAVVVPPDRPTDPEPVFLLDHGRHATLVLSRGDGRLVRYAFGDWAYYARNRVGFRRGAAALLWATPAALGRRELAGTATAAGVRSAVRVPIETLHRLEVAGSRVATLGARLNARFARRLAQRRFNPWYDLVFVPVSESYWLGNNSNQRVAAWLEVLGAEVRGASLWSRWVLRPPDV